MAVRYIVAKFSRTPAIARASPEVYRDLQRYVVEPPNSKWVWSCRDSNLEGFTDSKPVIFDPMFDVLYISPDYWIRRQERQTYLDRSPFYLSKKKDAALAIDQQGISALAMWKKLADQCFLGRKKCIVVLNKTRLIKPAEWIASCGLFGLLGEERTVLIDVDEENPKVKLWLDKLPPFTFAVRVHAQDLEEGARLLSVREAHRRAWLEECGFLLELG